MKVLYSDDPAFTGNEGIFLAGPTPRDKEVKSWRPEAIQILSYLGFEGTVLVPEHKGNNPMADYTGQVEWEYEGLNRASVIAFWIPRNLATMPALTTNVEFGYYLALASTWTYNEDAEIQDHVYRIIYGRPSDSPKNRYLDWLYSKVYPYCKPENTLQGTMEWAISAYNMEHLGD